MRLPRLKKRGKLATVRDCSKSRFIESVQMSDKSHLWQPGQSGNPGGKPKQKFMTEALQFHLLRPADLPPHKPRNAAEAIAGQIVKQALEGDSTSQQLCYDRMEGKAIQTIKDETERAPMDIMEAARRLAFALNSAALLGEPVDARFSKLVDVTPKPAEPVAIADNTEPNQ